MLALCASDVTAASEISIPVLSAGGKRIRPALVILSALAAGASISQHLLDLAAATEFMHTASLIHDDVVDETTERRGMPTTKFEWGSKLSVLGGDFLLAKAFCLVSSVGDPAILNVLSSTGVKMSESEILQATCEGRLDAWEENYWRIIRDKTAAFMGACCECGALLASEDDAVRSALLGYGTQLGLAFQITDDLLDITGDPVETGKDVGSDLVHGKFTLPVLLALKNIDEQHRRDILSSFYKGPISHDNAREIAGLVVESGAAKMAREVACGYADNACRALDAIPSSEHLGCSGNPRCCACSPHGVTLAGSGALT